MEVGMELSRWLWNDADVQVDLAVLQEKYQQLGYTLTKEQAYDAWYMYSEFCCANWLNVNTDIQKSEWCAKKILHNR